MAVETLLAPIVEITITKVISVAQEQIDLVAGYEEDLRRFCVTLEMARGLLLHAEEKKATGDPGVSVWLKELRRIADEADAVLDEIAYESLRRKRAQKKIRKQVNDFFTPSNPLAVRLRMASKINYLIAALVELNNKASGFGLQTILANKTGPERREMISQTDALLGDPSIVIGRENEAQEIVRMLVEPSNDQPLAVVSIVGVGGLGKTTLAKLVCNNEEITGYFSKILWVCVSENFDVLRILKEMLQALSQNSSKDLTSQNVVANKIKEELKAKNFLLVLDDVWSEDEQKWESLRNCLLGITQNARRSRVLVTTRIPKVVSIMRSLPGRIEQLNDDDCWLIIKQRAFDDSFVPLELEEIGREIAIKCRGVPLVANVVGGTLHDDKSKDHWLSIAEGFRACGPLDHNDLVLQALKLSFDRLPKPALKQCFAFCSIFPKDSVLEKEMLVQVWMAQGFFQQPQGCRKEMGEEYLIELVSYSFFQDVKKDFYGEIVSCKMHDLMHDLATSISKSETLVVEDGGTSDILDIRHMNLICAPSMGPTKTMKVIQELHSLFSEVDVFQNIPVEFKSLLALSFRGANISELPSLGNLKRLRYLDVSDTKIKEIPKSISKLYLLQTFRFTRCRFMKKPIEGIENLSNLKHIHFDDVKLMPAGVGSLSCLQTLPLFVVKHQEGYRIEELGQLNQLMGDLKIFNVGLVSDRAEALKAKLYEKAAIRSLHLEFNSKGAGDRDDDDVLEGLRPHSNLKGFTLRHYEGKNCPGWMLESAGNLGEPTCLENLKRMEFFNCYTLKSIPSLLLSKLMEMQITYCGGLESIEFLSLNKSGKLTIRDCDNLKSIAISSLKSLEIGWCNKLVSVRVGSIAVASLKQIRIEGCEKLEILPKISELPLLEILSLRNCENLSCMGDVGTSFASTCLVVLDLYECPNLASIPSLEGKVSFLRTLSISHPRQMESIKWESFLSTTCLKKLAISCDGLVHLPSLSGFSSLQTVEIFKCRKLTSIEGESFILPSCLKSFSIRQCAILTSISIDGFSAFSSCCCLKEMFISDCPALASIKPLRVEKLYISSCPALMSLSLDGFSSSSMCLEELSVSVCPALTTFPNLHGFTCLQRLCVQSCGLRRLPDGLESLLHVSSLVLGPFSEELEEFPDLSPMKNLHSALEKLTLNGWDKLKSLPCQIEHLTALRNLEIWSFNKLEVLPDWLGNLFSLQSLEIRHCDSLMYEPSIEIIQNLSNLEFLWIRECLQLEERYARVCGTKLDKLSHIPNIRVGGAPTESRKADHIVGGIHSFVGEAKKQNLMDASEAK